MLLLLAGCSPSLESDDALKVQVTRFAALPSTQQVRPIRNSPPSCSRSKLLDRRRANRCQHSGACLRSVCHRVSHGAAVPRFSEKSIRFGQPFLCNSRRLPSGKTRNLEPSSGHRKRSDEQSHKRRPAATAESAIRCSPDDESLNAVQTGCRIEGFAAAEMLAPSSSRTRQSFHSKNVAASAAARLRGKPISMLVSPPSSFGPMRRKYCMPLPIDPAASVATLQRLQQLLVAQLSDWPSDDKRMWAAETAQGLLTFGIGAAGHFNALVNSQQRANMDGGDCPFVEAEQLPFAQHRQRRTLLSAAATNRQAGKSSYWQRQATIESLQTELQTRFGNRRVPLRRRFATADEFCRRPSANSPKIAGGLRSLADGDRRRLRAPLGTPPTCSLTGQPYEVQVDPQRLLMSRTDLKTWRNHRSPPARHRSSPAARSWLQSHAAWVLPATPAHCGYNNRMIRYQDFARRCSRLPAS